MSSEKPIVGAGESSPAPGGSALRIDDFATEIIEGGGGLNDYERHELVVWPYSDRIAASVWTMRCLANPACEGSDVALAAILARREAMKQNKALSDLEH
jgi:hypothetical protein